MEPLQSFRISDALRCTLLNVPRGSNLACPRESLSGVGLTRRSALLWQNAVLQPKNRVALARWEGIRLGGLVSARTRTGHRAWEIDGFYLPSADFGRPNNGNSHSDGIGRFDAALLPDAGSLELLEQLILVVGCRSAERVFLRLPSDSPALTLARRSGFMPCFTETLLEGYGGPGFRTTIPAPAISANEGPVIQGPVIQGQGELRPRLPQDDYALFQLFCAGTPVAVREALGLTFDQWRDAREPHFGKAPGGRQQEWVAECAGQTGRAGRTVGWVGINPRRQAVEAEIMAHPDHPEVLSQLLDFALARPGLQRWLTPNYRENVADRLCRHGFRAVAQYTMLVKLVAVPALRYGMAPMEA